MDSWLDWDPFVPDGSRVIASRGIKRTADELDADDGRSSEEPQAKRSIHNDTPEHEDEQPSNEMPAKRRLKRKECTLCCTDVAVNRFPKAPHTGHEQHDRNVCFKCWEQHLAVELENKEWNSLSCPDCDKVLEEHEIKKLDASFAESIYAKWLDKAAKSCLTDDEEYYACPSAECSWGCFMATKEDGNIFRCQMCQYRYCIICEVPMHEDATCGEYQAEQKRKADREEQARQNQLSEDTVNETSKPCPNCKVNIEKNLGCDHMTCRRCRHEFCWICFVPYTGEHGVWRLGNTAHRTSCTYSPNRLPDYEGTAESSDEDGLE